MKGIPKHHIWHLGILLILPFIIAGCWDRIELDKRAIVIAIGIDLPHIAEQENPAVEAGGDAHNRPPRFLMSTEIALLRAIGQQSSGSSGLIPDLQKPAYVFSGTGRTLYAIERMLASRMSRTFFWGHVKTIIIGEELARETGLFPIMDFLTRDLEFDRRMHIGIADGEARTILQSTIPSDEFTGTYIANILENTNRTSRAPRTNINQLDGQLQTVGHALLPRFILGDDEVKVAGSAIIKDGKLIGWLGELETQWALFVRDEIKGGWILVPDPAHPEEEVLFSISSSNTNLRLDTTENRISFQIAIEIGGDILERVAFPQRLNTEIVGQVERAVAHEIEAGVRHVINEMQHTYYVDVLGFGDYLQKLQPQLWKQLSEQWDEVGFGEIEVSVHADVTMRRRGTTR